MMMGKYQRRIGIIPPITAAEFVACHLINEIEAMVVPGSKSRYYTAA
jgi:hypothetical protein